MRRSHSFPVIDGKRNPTIHKNQGTTKNKIERENDAENMKGFIPVALFSPNTGRNTSIVECEVHALPAAVKELAIAKVLKVLGQVDKIPSSDSISSPQDEPTSKDSSQGEEPVFTACVVNDISFAAMQSTSFNTKSTSWPIKKCKIEDDGDIGNKNVSGSSPNLDKNTTRVNLKHNKASKQIMISATNTFFPYITVPKNVNLSN